MKDELILVLDDQACLKHAEDHFEFLIKMIKPFFISAYVHGAKHTLEDVQGRDKGHVKFESQAKRGGK